MAEAVKQNKKERVSFGRWLINLVTSKRSRNIVFALFIVFATLAMFFIDKGNALRDKKGGVLNFLTDNFVADFFIMIGIERYNVTASAWLLFGCIMAVVVMIFLGNIIAPKFVENKVKKNSELFSSEKKIRIFYTIVYYVFLVFLAGLIVVGAYFLGAFDYFYSNKDEKSPFISLLTMLGIFLAFLFAIVLAAFIVYALVRCIIAIFMLLKKDKKESKKAAENVKVEAAATEAPVTEPAKEEVIVVKAEDKQEEKKEDKPEVKEEPKPETKEDKPAKKSDAKKKPKTVVKATKKPEEKKEAKPVVKTEAKPEPKVEAKPEVKKEVKPAAKPVVKAEVKPAAKKTAKPAVKPAAKKGTKPAAKPAVKPEVKPEPKEINKSFIGKMHQATKEQIAYYGDVKNYLLSYSGVSSKTGWSFDNYYVGGKTAIKIGFVDDGMVAYLALKPADYKGSKYYPHDVSGDKKFATTPMMVNIKSERGVKFLKELIDVVCKGLKKNKFFVSATYSFAKMSDKQLTELGLAR